MKLRLSTQETIELPKEYSQSQRLSFVNEILEKHPLEFQYNKNMFDVRYGQRQDSNRLIKVKLDILATYLIRSDEKYTKDVMSRYKEERRPVQEMAFSQFNPDLIDINGWN